MDRVDFKFHYWNKDLAQYLGHLWHILKTTRCLSLRIHILPAISLWFGVSGMPVMNNTINSVYVRFNDPQVDSIAVLNQYTVPIEKYKTDITICKGNIGPSIKRTQFPESESQDLQ